MRVCQGVLHVFPSEGCIFSPEALRSHLLKYGLSSQDEGSMWGWGWEWE